MTSKRGRESKFSLKALTANFDFDESSSDSDFNIDNCSDPRSDEEYDEDAEPGSTSSSDESDDESEDDSDDDNAAELQILLNEQKQDNDLMLQKLNDETTKQLQLPTKPVCCVCLGLRSDDANEIAECDGCGVSVHEVCYGITESASISSTDSTCSTEPWFCEACRAGVSRPTCELCPVVGGIFKETDMGKWVHLICALYIPQVAFADVDQLTTVTLFELPYTKWGAKACSLCENPRYERTGVCIGCDAGMCRTYFHVTCAQKAGFLTDVHPEEANDADPYFANCKQHSEKEHVKRRQRSYNIFVANMLRKQKERMAMLKEPLSTAMQRVERKLQKCQRKYAEKKSIAPQRWVLTQKMSRSIFTSATFIKRQLHKIEVVNGNVEIVERRDAQIAALQNVHKKWHVPPAFSVEFVAYYSDRIGREQKLKQQCADLLQDTEALTLEEEKLRKQCEKSEEENKALKKSHDTFVAKFNQLQQCIMALCPNKQLPDVASIGRTQIEPPKPATPPIRPISVPTAAALKMGVGFPLAHLGPPGTKVDSTRLLSTHVKKSPTISSTAGVSSLAAVQTFVCGICSLSSDQHLLAKCDTCQKHYHLGCLNPPLTRHPKKSKLYGWQCSECDKSDEDSLNRTPPKGQRAARKRFFHDINFVMPTTKAARKLTTDVQKPKTTKAIKSTQKQAGAATGAAAAAATEPIAVENFETVDIEQQQTATKVAVTTNVLPAPTPLIELPVDEVAHCSSVPATLDPLQDPLAATNETSNVPMRKPKRKKSKHNSSSETDVAGTHKHKKQKKHHKDKTVGDANNDRKIPKLIIKLDKGNNYYTQPNDNDNNERAASVENAADESLEATINRTGNATPNSSPLKLNKTVEMPATIGATKTTSTRKKPGPKRIIRSPRIGRQIKSTPPNANAQLTCCVCAKDDLANKMVTCDLCKRHYHFSCLDPPVKKSPKIRGYSWHCAECDTEEEATNPRSTSKLNKTT